MLKVGGGGGGTRGRERKGRGGQSQDSGAEMSRPRRTSEIHLGEPDMLKVGREGGKNTHTKKN